MIVKYTCTVEIELPINEVVTLWSDENNFAEWQDGFQSKKLLHGVKGEPGARSLIKFREGNRSMELTETIQSNDLPHSIKGLYEHKHMTNVQISLFEQISERQTKYVSQVVYTQFNGFIPNLMARFFPRVFQKQSQKWMDQFKAYAESLNKH